MIGLSLSRCIGDIATGKIRLREVDLVLTSCRWKDDRSWDAILETYGSTFWILSKARAMRIARILKRMGKIRQIPKEEGRSIDLGSGHWSADARDIKWVSA